MKNKKLNNGFTLIELLTVIAIIGLLAGMLFGAFGAVRNSAKKTKARSDVDQIKLAWTQYLAQYHTFDVFGNGAADVSGHPTDKAALDVLCGYDETHNRMEIAFLDFSKDKNDFKDKIMSFKDPWGNEYRFSLDAGGDNEVTVNGQTIKEAVAVWSLGPDGVEFTGDDVKSWR